MLRPEAVSRLVSLVIARVAKASDIQPGGDEYLVGPSRITGKACHEVSYPVISFYIYLDLFLIQAP
jgi:hypothetical protein